MDILLKEQLKRLRKDKGNTQEDLATHLGITVQAVSKWERGEGYPDITLLPAIAAYYNVSVDDLLDVGARRKAKIMEEYLKKHAVLCSQGKTTEQLELWRQAEKEFPNDLEVIYFLMYALDTVDSKGNAEEVIACGERLLAESTDPLHRNGAIQMLCYIHHDLGNIDEAKKYANMASVYHSTRNELMAALLEGDEAVEQCQSNIQVLMDLIWMNTSYIVWKGSYSPEDAIKAYTFALNGFRWLYPDENYGFYHCRVSEIYQRLACVYAVRGDADPMFDCLEKAAEFAIKYDTMGSGNFTAFMVNRLKFDETNISKNYTENDSGLLLKVLQRDPYTKYQEDAHMAAVMEKLKTVAQI